jgi:hypothetical protein
LDEESGLFVLEQPQADEESQATEQAEEKGENQESETNGS